MSQTDGIMDEPLSHPGFGNFSDLYLGMSYVGYQLEKYTVDGVEKIHATIAGSLKTSSKCTSRCSLQFGRNFKQWCSLCDHWRRKLTDYLHSDKVAWERMESWKWPDSYTNIIEVFVPTICSVNTPFLQDLYVQSYIWDNCKVFKIKSTTLRGLRVVRNAIVHNCTTCVTNAQMEKCFNVLETLLGDSDVDAYLNSTECKGRLYSIQHIQNLGIASPVKRILSDMLLTQTNYRINTKDSELHTFSQNTIKRIHEKFQVHQNIINRLNIVLSRPCNIHPCISEVVLLLILLITSVHVTLLYAFSTRREAVPILDISNILANFFPIPAVLGVTNLDFMMLFCITSQHPIPRQMQRRSDQLSESKYPTKGVHAVTRAGEWDRCLNSEDVALLADMIHQGFLPDREQLDRTCAVFTQNSMIIDLVTDEICKSIKHKYADKVRRVCAAYEPCRENHIVFVIIIKEKDENTDIEFKPDYKYDERFRQDGDFNSESKEVIFEENAQDLFPEEDDIIKVQQCIKGNTSTLMKNHSNLTLMSASLLKCKGYGTVNCKTERKICIVLHVHVKGLIPLRESLFPKQIGDIDIDVREGCLMLNSGKGPHEKHQNVKMGCGIKTKNQDDCGTLGGFIEHPKYGLCALTCAHVIFDDIKLLKNQRKEFENEHVECVQPCYEDSIEGSRFGTLKLTVLLEGTTDDFVGLEYALIAVDKDRAPLDGSFPSAKKEELNEAGFDDPPSFETGKVIDYKKLTGKRPQCSVVKYGSTTILTRGMVRWLPPTISFKDSLTGITLLNQIQINLIKTTDSEKKIDTFSAGGDSGALVFKVDDNNKLTAVGLLVAGNAKLGFSVATPICDILADIGVERLKNFTDSIETENESVNQNLFEKESPKKNFCRYYCEKIRKFFSRIRGKRGKQN